MANRSDFFGAKIPRTNKKLISMGEASGAIDKAQARALRKMFAEAHAHHVASSASGHAPNVTSRRSVDPAR